jgi:hypothetical protein
MPFVAKTVTGAGAFAACYIPWPIPDTLDTRWLPEMHLRWWPVAVWMLGWVWRDTIRWERDDSDDGYDMATLDNYGTNDYDLEETE